MNKKLILPDAASVSSHRMWRQYQSDKPQSLLPTGAPLVDQRLQGGIARDGLHEFFGTENRDATAAGAFALLIALRLPDPDRYILWISSDKERQASGRISASGLAEMGADPARILLIQTVDLRDALRAAADGIRSRAAGAVILEAQGNARLLDLTSTRRLVLAAREVGVLVLLVRDDAVPMPSAANTRWQVRSAPSVTLLGNAPGLATFHINLLRHRGGTAPFEARVTWDHGQKSFYDAPLSGGLSATVIGGTTDPDARQQSA